MKMESIKTHKSTRNDETPKTQKKDCEYQC